MSDIENPFLFVIVEALAIVKLAAILQIHDSHKSRKQFSGIMSLHNNLPSLLENWSACPQPQKNTYSNFPKSYINHFSKKATKTHFALFNILIQYVPVWYIFISKIHEENESQLGTFSVIQ